MTPKLQAEFDAAKRLLALIHDDVADDDELRETSIDGETELLPAIDASLRRLSELSELTKAAKSEAATIQARAARFAAAEKRMRDELASIMVALDLRKLERPIATLSLGKGRVSLDLTDPAEVPRQYYTQPAPAIDERMISDALKAGAFIPGATLLVGGPVLSIRRA